MKPVKTFDVEFNITKRVIAFDRKDAILQLTSEINKENIKHLKVINVTEVNIIKEQTNKKDSTPKIGSGSINDQYEFNKNANNF